MHNAVIFVDAGYLYRAGADAVAHRNVPRRDVELEDVPGLIDAILARVASLWDGDNLRLLRTYWYDGARDGIPSGSQIAVGDLPRVKLRLGRVSGGGQKGVDGLIILDLITLARNGAADVAVLVSGDEDLRETIAHVQSFGVTVVVAGFPRSPRQAQSVLLLREADHCVALSADDVRHHFCITDGAGVESDAAAVARLGGPADPVVSSPNQPPATRPGHEGIAEPSVSSSAVNGAPLSVAAEAAAPPQEAADASLRSLCLGVISDQRFAVSGVVDPRDPERLRHRADQVLVARLAELTGEFPVDAGVLTRARLLCIELEKISAPEVGLVELP